MHNRQAATVPSFGAAADIPGDVDLITFRRNCRAVGSLGGEAVLFLKKGMQKSDDLLRLRF